MKMTMTQKILAAHAGLSEVTAGQLINVKPAFLNSWIATGVVMSLPSTISSFALMS